jgi:hypothetical protein
VGIRHTHVEVDHGKDMFEPVKPLSGVGTKVLSNDHGDGHGKERRQVSEVSRAALNEELIEELGGT